MLAFSQLRTGFSKWSQQQETHILGVSQSSAAFVIQPASQSCLNLFVLQVKISITEWWTISLMNSSARTRKISLATKEPFAVFAQHVNVLNVLCHQVHKPGALPIISSFNRPLDNYYILNFCSVLKSIHSSRELISTHPSREHVSKNSTPIFSGKPWNLWKRRCVMLKFPNQTCVSYVCPHYAHCTTLWIH